MATVPNETAVDAFPVDYAGEWAWTLLLKRKPALALMESQYKPAVVDLVKALYENDGAIIQAQDDPHRALLKTQLIDKKKTIRFNLIKPAPKENPDAAALRDAPGPVGPAPIPAAGGPGCGGGGETGEEKRAGAGGPGESPPNDPS